MRTISDMKLPVLFMLLSVLLFSLVLIPAGCHESTDVPRCGATPGNEPPVAEGENTAEGEREAEGEEPAVTDWTCEVVATYPHDPEAFTQGLDFDGGLLYEGTGIRGKSELRLVELDTGLPVQIHELDASLFGEGIAVVGDEIFQLTWKGKTCFVYSKSTFELLRQFEYPTEGWGLTCDGENLIMSDGTSMLYWLAPTTGERIASVSVCLEGEPLSQLNELEYISGEIYANVWRTNSIVRINPVTGEVTGRINLAGLLTAEEALEADVLNGIAWDEVGKRLFVTGKLWPKLFHIQLIPVE